MCGGIFGEAFTRQPESLNGANNLAVAVAAGRCIEGYAALSAQKDVVAATGIGHRGTGREWPIYGTGPPAAIDRTLPSPGLPLYRRADRHECGAGYCCAIRRVPRFVSKCRPDSGAYKSQHFVEPIQQYSVKDALGLSLLQSAPPPCANRCLALMRQDDP